VAPPNLLALFRIALRLGSTSFGGPIAAIGMLEEEYCRRRKLLSAEEFHELYSLCKLLPGPVATQLFIGVNHRVGGLWGGILGGLGYILPAFLLMIFFSWLVLDCGLTELAGFEPFVAKIQLAALALIWVAAWNLFLPLVRGERRNSVVAWVLITWAAIVAYPPLLKSEPLLILGAGFFSILSKHKRPRELGSFLLGSMSWGPALFPTLNSLFAFGVKAATITFGTGLAIIPLLESDAVLHHQWLSSHEFMTGITLGQITPGPVVITLTYVGYKVAGFLGACIATIGVFLPAFLIMLFLIPRIQVGLKKSGILKDFAVGAIPIIVGAILATATRLSIVATTSVPNLLILLGLILASLRFKISAWKLILIGAVLGWGSNPF